ncbi:NUDIX hydrolase [Actinomadura bangladeshensis]|uniref:NUDIX domain-containing protein n=1 Tax=Actinomadura bangladeshensis TaxID=453573 RepID=A0A4V2XL83_9ACTN|nr:NUDIX domain-containing protein [Actinomadura bangladeshensis]TDC09396.1 NUDIX domain-containing protein [Actinomadura bangladeshensis]
MTVSRTIDKVAWIHTENRRILSTRSQGKTRYYIPGGKREGDESDLETLAREIREELSVDLQVDEANFLGIFEAQADSHPEGISVIMRCYECPYDGEIKADSEIAEVVWLDYADRWRSSPVDQIIFDWLQQCGRL